MPKITIETGPFIQAFAEAIAKALVKHLPKSAPTATPAPIPSPASDKANRSRLAYSIKTLSEATGASESAIYKDIQLGLLESFLEGKRHLIMPTAAKAWLTYKGAAGKRHQKNKKVVAAKAETSPGNSAGN
jgi:hypothetical protein